MAPEIFENKDYSTKADVYSFAVSNNFNVYLKLRYVYGK